MTKFGVQLPGFSGFDPSGLFEHVAGLVAGHIEADADEVIFSFAFAGIAGITALGKAFGLSGR